MLLSLAILVLVVSYAAHGIFPVGGYWLAMINELGSQVLQYRMRARKVLQWHN